MPEDKLKTFAAHILEECAQEGFTIAEVKRLPQELRFLVGAQISEIHEQAKFTCQQAVRTAGTDSGIHSQNR